MMMMIIIIIIIIIIIFRWWKLSYRFMIIVSMEYSFEEHLVMETTLVLDSEIEEHLGLVFITTHDKWMQYFSHSRDILFSAFTDALSCLGSRPAVITRNNACMFCQKDCSIHDNACLSGWHHIVWVMCTVESKVRLRTPCPVHSL